MVRRTGRFVDARKDERLPMSTVITGEAGCVGAHLCGGHVNPIGPRGCYDEAKRFAEAITMAYHRYHGVKTRIVRIFNTYGPRMRLNDGRVLPAFMSQVLRGEPLTVFGKGDQTRSFCFVTDLVDGIYRLLHSEVTDPVNIGNPSDITVLELAEE